MHLNDILQILHSETYLLIYTVIQLFDSMQDWVSIHLTPQ